MSCCAWLQVKALGKFNDMQRTCNVCSTVLPKTLHLHASCLHVLCVTLLQVKALGKFRASQRTCDACSTVSCIVSNHQNGC
jgi:hypothetical protein